MFCRRLQNGNTEDSQIMLALPSSRDETSHFFNSMYDMDTILNINLFGIKSENSNFRTSNPQRFGKPINGICKRHPMSCY